MRGFLVLPLALIVFSFMSVFFSPAQPVYADHCGTRSALGIHSWDVYLESRKQHENDCAITGFQLSDIWLIVLALIDIAIRIAAYVAAGYIIWGGVKLLMSQGNPDNIQKGKSIITNAIIGLVLSLTATTLVTFVAGAFK